MFKKIKKLYFKIYHLFKLLGVFALFFIILQPVKADTTTYLIRDGTCISSCTYTKTGGSGNGSFTQNYNNQNVAYATSQAWSSFTLTFASASVSVGDVVYVRYNRPSIWSGNNAQYAEFRIETTNPSNTQINSVIFHGSEPAYSDFKVYSYTIEQDSDVSLYFQNLTSASNYTPYGVEISDFYIVSSFPSSNAGEVYSNFLSIFINRFVYLTTGFTFNPYLFSFIGIIFSFIVLYLFFKFLNLRIGGRRK